MERKLPVAIRNRVVLKTGEILAFGVDFSFSGVKRGIKYYSPEYVKACLHGDRPRDFVNYVEELGLSIENWVQTNGSLYTPKILYGSSKVDDSNFNDIPTLVLYNYGKIRELVSTSKKEALIQIGNSFSGFTQLENKFPLVVGSKLYTLDEYRFLTETPPYTKDLDFKLSGSNMAFKESGVPLSVKAKRVGDFDFQFMVKLSLSKVMNIG